MEGIRRQATLLFVLNGKLYQEIPPPSWKSSETEVVYDIASFHYYDGLKYLVLTILYQGYLQGDQMD